MCSYSYELNVRFRAWWVVVVQLQCCVSRGEKKKLHACIVGHGCCRHLCLPLYLQHSSKHGMGTDGAGLRLLMPPNKLGPLKPSRPCRGIRAHLAVTVYTCCPKYRKHRLDRALAGSNHPYPCMGNGFLPHLLAAGSCAS